MNIVSLLPSATEIIYALGLDDQLVAVTHECDFPDRVSAKPAITRNVLRQDLTSAEIDAAVRSQLSTDAHTISTIDRDLLARLSPHLIVTQQLC
ncbi:MAG: cobalamin-binding protein, partial [Ktedonobacterales bacterium]